jgi:hypothetical protein
VISKFLLNTPHSENTISSLLFQELTLKNLKEMYVHLHMGVLSRDLRRSMAPPGNLPSLQQRAHQHFIILQNKGPSSAILHTSYKASISILLTSFTKDQLKIKTEKQAIATKQKIGHSENRTTAKDLPMKQAYFPQL